MFFIPISYFLYLKRSYITKPYLFFTCLTGVIFGFSLGNLLNVRYAVTLYDKLGNEFEISRNAKQSIFNKRRDLTAIQKAEIYRKYDLKKS